MVILNDEINGGDWSRQGLGLSEPEKFMDTGIFYFQCNFVH